MLKAMAVYLYGHYKGILTGILVGVCVTYLFQIASNSTSLQSAEAFWNGFNSCSPSPISHNQQAAHPPTDNFIDSMSESNGLGENHDHALVDKTNLRKEMVPHSDRKRIALLLAMWEASSLLATRRFDDPLLKTAGVLLSEVPRAPHLENCKAHVEINKRLDDKDENGTWPDWTFRKGQQLGLSLGTIADDSAEFDMVCSKISTTEFFHPPWVVGADEDNLPLTRRVQGDIWQHQHPKNCQDPNLRFLLADWETDPGFGMGAQIVSMAGLLAIALREKRILVSNYFNRADHEGCLGPDHSHWSCYFFSETSEQCRERAVLLASQSIAWEQGLITGKNNYTSRQIWTGKIPKCWGEPWEIMQSMTEIDGKLLGHHKALDRRWWRAQAVRYLMRFPSEYMCSLLNLARHDAFGVESAKLVLDSLPPSWPQVRWLRNETDMDKFVWEMHKPWVPRPLISIHVRQGDKAREMKIVGFKSYMMLAQQLRNRFPHARSIWLSTEMQDVIEESHLYSSQWDIYFTNVTRQIGNMSMPAYEALLGRKLSTDYPLVNFLIATNADFFIGALGSTWSFLIDGMRTTGGRVMAGYLSVNKDRFW